MLPHLTEHDEWYTRLMQNPLIVVFDDKCPVCIAGKNLSKKLDSENHIEFVGMHSEQGVALIEKYELNMAVSAYAIQDGIVTEKERMMLSILKHNGVAGKILSIPFSLPFFGKALYWALSQIRTLTTRAESNVARN